MKKALLLLLLLLVCAPVFAQSTAVPDSLPGRFFVGFGLGNATYPLQHDNRPAGSFSPVTTVHTGYWLTKRASLQLGITYGSVKFALLGTAPGSQNQLAHIRDSYHTRSYSASLTGRYVISNPERRLQLYLTASIIPVWATTRVEGTVTEDGTITSRYTSKESDVQVFASAGPGISYRLSKRLEWYTEVPLLHHNLSGKAYQKKFMFRSGLNFSL